MKKPLVKANFHKFAQFTKLTKISQVRKFVVLQYEMLPNQLFGAWVCKRGVPSFSTVDKTMKTLGAKAFLEVYQVFFIFLKNFFQNNDIKG